MFHHLTAAWLKKLMEEPGLSPTITNQGLYETVKIMMAVVMWGHISVQLIATTLALSRGPIFLLVNLKGT